MTCLHRSGAAHNFYPRPPRGGRRPCAHCSPLGGRISIHALREEGDEGRGGQFCSLDIFLSTPSARRATWHHRHVYGPQRISIHALREEGDNTSNTTTAPARKISIHALREEGDGSSSKGNGKACKFLSTPSARRATTMAYRSVSNFRISIHALREEGDNSAEAATNRAWQISIHALREEGDNRTSGAASKTTPFLSTPSARRATVETGKKTKTEVFLSTPSARRATDTVDFPYEDMRISIHALREEGDGM